MRKVGQSHGGNGWSEIPATGYATLPDVSLFAANGVWGHYYAFCWSDEYNGGTPCSGTPDNWSGAGGTSFSSPIMAGIQALVNQTAGGRQGNPNPIYYKLAAILNMERAATVPAIQALEMPSAARAFFMT